MTGINTVYIHPIVLLSISDHYTRLQHNKNNTNNSKVVTQLFGILFGTCNNSPNNNNNNIAIFDCIDVLYGYDEQLHNDIELYQTCLSNYNIVGYYTNNNDNDNTHHYNIVQQLHNKKYLNNDYIIKIQVNDLQQVIYDNSTDELSFNILSHKLADGSLTKLNYTLQLDDTERIVCLNNTLQSSNDNHTSQIINHYDTVQQSVNTLSSKLRSILQYIQNTQQDSNKQLTPEDIDILNQLQSVTQQSLVNDKQSLDNGYYSNMCDLLSLQCISEMTQGMSHIYDVNDKFTATHNSLNRRNKHEIGVYSDDSNDYSFRQNILQQLQFSSFI